MATEVNERAYEGNPLYHPGSSWDVATELNQEAIIAQWVGFLVLTFATLFLGYNTWIAKGPSGKKSFFAGYRETETCIPIFVNLLASVTYFGKITASSYGLSFNNQGPLIIGLGNYRYADYMLSCPLLVLDMLIQLRAPYKLSMAVLIFVTLLIGLITNFYPSPKFKGPAVAWFVFGCFWFAIAYAMLYIVVKKQYKKLCNLAEGTEAKKALLPLRLASLTFFTVWLLFPIVWLLGPAGINIITDNTQEILHVFCDISAKSFYGFALMRFRSYYDKKMYELLEKMGVDAEEELMGLERDLEKNDDESTGKGSSTKHHEAWDPYSSFHHPYADKVNANPYFNHQGSMQMHNPGPAFFKEWAMHASQNMHPMMMGMMAPPVGGMPYAGMQYGPAANGGMNGGMIEGGQNDSFSRDSQGQGAMGWSGPAVPSGSGLSFRGNGVGNGNGSPTSFNRSPYKRRPSFELIREAAEMFPPNNSAAQPNSFSRRSGATKMRSAYQERENVIFPKIPDSGSLRTGSDDGINFSRPGQEQAGARTPPQQVLRNLASAVEDMGSPSGHRNLPSEAGPAQDPAD